MNKTFWCLLACLSLAALSVSAQFTGSTGSGSGFNNYQPTLAIRYIICVQGIFPSNDDDLRWVDRSQPMLGEIRAVAFNATLPAGWAECRGQMLAINQNQALYFVISTNYGGNGQTTIQLPNLSGRVPIGAGQGPGLTNYVIGRVYGEDSGILSPLNLPEHLHSTPNGNSGPVGGGVSFNNLQPALAVSFIMSESGEVALFAGNYAPFGWVFCDGRLLSIASEIPLFTRIGSTYGGDGKTNFKLPDLRGRTPVGAGQSPGLSDFPTGRSSGAEHATLTVDQMPAHTHTLAGTNITGSAGSSSSFDNRQPSQALHWYLSIAAPPPEEDETAPLCLGELRLTATVYTPLGTDWMLAHGQSLAPTENVPLFNLIGTRFGGDGTNTFHLPDTRGHVTVSTLQSFGTRYLELGDTAGSESVTLIIPELARHSHALPLTLHCPATISTNNAAGQCAQTVSFAAVAPGDPAPVITYQLGTSVITSPYNFPLGTNIVTVTATNGVDPDAHCSFAVIVRDTEPPVMACALPVLVTSDGGYCPQVVTFSGGASDCALANVYSVPPSGSAFPVGTNLVTTYAVDAFGNTNSCVFTVTVLPGLAPSLTATHVGTRVVISWSEVFGCYTLERASGLSSVSNTWTNVLGNPVLIGGNYHLTNAAGANQRFFRLKY